MKPFPTLKTMITAVTLIVLATSSWGLTITEDLKIIADDGSSSDMLGYSVAMDGAIIAAGARYDDPRGNNSGSAYLFNATTGAQIANFYPAEWAPGAWFGHSIAIDNGVLAVGSPINGAVAYASGAVYLYDVATEELIAKIFPDDGALNDQFGTSVALADGIVAIGAVWDDDNGLRSGSAYLFDATTGDQIMKLLPDDGVANAEFGASIDINNGVVAVGAYLDDDNGPLSGSVYLFDALTGEQLNKLKPDDGAAIDHFGASVALGKSVIVIGSDWDDDLGSVSGSAYLFDVATGNQITKLTAFDGASGERFGYSVAIGNGVVVVGAYQGHQDGSNAGAAYLFNATNGSLIEKLVSSDLAMNDEFGWSLAIDQGLIAVGARFEDDNGSNSGSVYVFNVNNVGVEENTEQLPASAMTLYQNHPNPFNPSTTIRYTLEYPGEVELAIYSVRGVRVRTLVHERKTSGTEHAVIWDGTDDQGRVQPSGVYFSRLQSEGSMKLQKMVLMK